MEMTINDLLAFLIGLFKGGWKEPAKIVRKCTPTSGAIYLHKRYIGRTFDVYLIPVEKEPQVKDEVTKAEEKFKNVESS